MDAPGLRSVQPITSGTTDVHLGQGLWSEDSLTSSRWTLATEIEAQSEQRQAHPTSVHKGWVSQPL